VGEGHRIAQELEVWLCSTYPGLKDVVVHVEPDDAEQRAKPFLAAKHG
jgi:divalent metal cation (Fe/Co/Zn/Cd) transporter